ncbi:MAG: MFS transporter [Aquisalinus sp.]|nr:MFS transporter [Aquisalinus sp.]
MSSTDVSAAEASVPKAGNFFFQRRFLPMWSAFVLGVFTDNMLKQALLIGLTYKVITLPGISDPAVILPFAGALFALAVFMFSPLSGQVADKFETSFMFRRTKFIEFILMLMAAVGFLINNGPLLILTLFFMGIQSAFFSPVRIGAMPKYLTPGELVRGNGICYGGLFVANLTGYAVGGGLIEAAFGPMLISIILVLMAAAGWGAVMFAPKAAADSPDLKINWNWFSQVGSMIRMVRDEPPIIRPLLGGGIFWFIAAAITVAFPIITSEVLQAKGTVATVMMGIFAVGGLIGAAITTLVPKHKSGLSLSVAAFVFAILINVALFAVSEMMSAPRDGELMGVAEFFAEPGGVLLAVLFIFASAAMGIFLVPLQAAVQRRVRETNRARIMAASNMLNAFGAVLGSMFVLLIAITPMRPHDLLLVIGALELLVVIYMFRRQKAVPEGTYDEMLAGK